MVAVLDWGLGHATRCIPLIDALKQEYEVMVAGSGSSLLLLKKQYPTLQFFSLPPYRPVYGAGNMVMSMATQLPHFIRTIRSEHRQLGEIIAREQPQLIISDNRYGCYCAGVPSVFITHQVRIQMPPLWKWMEPTVNFFNHHQIRKFTTCWVPDAIGENSLAGKLGGNPNELPSVEYIGQLSRFQKMQVEKQYEVVAVLSGPEPARSNFEQLLRTQMKLLKKHCLLIRGLPELGEEMVTEGWYSEVAFMSSAALNKAMCAAETIVSRSGYSTLMDLAAIEGKALLIPTPGQTEQEYLAKEMAAKNVAAYMQQNHFDLRLGMKKAKMTRGFIHHRMDVALIQKKVKMLL